MRVIRSSRWLPVIKVVAFAGIFTLLSVSCGKNSYEGMIVAVELADENDISLEGSRLIAFDPGEPGDSATVLSKEFVSACAPAISHDGRYLFFQGKKEGDTWWQIWIMDLKKKSTYRVTDLPEDCTNPASLPDETIIFSRSGTMKNAHVNTLYRCNRDGSGLSQLTFTPSNNFHATILQEGRVLYVSNQQYPVYKTPVLMIMRPDGTKSEIYHQGDHGSYPISRGSESEDGHIYFINNHGRLIRLRHYRPLHTAVEVSAGLTGRFASVIPWKGASCLVSYQPTEDLTYALYKYNTESGESPELLYQGIGHITDPVRIAAMEERPRILPSAVNPENNTGLLMSQDINHSLLPSNPAVAGDTLADRIRVYGLDGLLGDVEVKEDGSFYMKLDADKPFRMETINAQGETVRGPSDWIYLRSNERRGCVGCHADPELAPENVQPLAVKGPPVIISVMKKEPSSEEEVAP